MDEFQLLVIVQQRINTIHQATFHTYLAVTMTRQIKMKQVLTTCPDFVNSDNEAQNTWSCVNARKLNPVSF